MPNSPSSEKRLRQGKIRQARNKTVKSAMRTQIKKVIAAAEAGEVEKAEAEFKTAAKKLDQAGAKNVIHQNAAGRQKSRMQRIIKQAKSK